MLEDLIDWILFQEDSSHCAVIGLDNLKHLLAKLLQRIGVALTFKFEGHHHSPESPCEKFSIGEFTKLAFGTVIMVSCPVLNTVILSPISTTSPRFHQP